MQIKVLLFISQLVIKKRYSKAEQTQASVQVLEGMTCMARLGSKNEREAWSQCPTIPQYMPKIQNLEQNYWDNLTVNIILCKYIREKEKMNKSTEMREGNQVHLDNGLNKMVAMPDLCLQLQTLM